MEFVQRNRGWRKVVEIEKIRVMLVLDSGLTKKSIFEDAESAVRAGVPAIQYREKEKTVREMLEDCRKLKEICAGKALFFVNDRVDIALAVGADGLHLGQEDLPVEIARTLLPNAVIGVTVHNLEEAVKAEKGGADYVSVSPIFHTDTKKDAGKEVGLEMVKRVRRVVSIPVMGIGGINAGNARKVIKAGADAVSVVSCIVASDDVEAASKELLEALK